MKLNLKYERLDTMHNELKSSHSTLSDKFAEVQRNHFETKQAFSIFSERHQHCESNIHQYLAVIAEKNNIIEDLEKRISREKAQSDEILRNLQQEVERLSLSHELSEKQAKENEESSKNFENYKKRAQLTIKKASHSHSLLACSSNLSCRSQSNDTIAKLTEEVNESRQTVSNLEQSNQTTLEENDQLKRTISELKDLKELLDQAQKEAEAVEQRHKLLEEVSLFGLF